MKRRLYQGFAIYAGTSYYLLHHPELLHDTQQKRLKLPILDKATQSHYVIAHRGGSMENPENTLQAFKNAVQNGAHMLETDVRMTKDGVIIVCHDDNFHRICGPHSSDAMVKDTELKDLPYFRDTLPIHFSKGQRYHMKEGDQRQFSTLEEVFQVIPNEVVFSIELKDRTNVEAQQELVRLIQKYNRQSTTVVGCEREEETLQLHALDGSIPKFCSGDSMVKYMFAYWLGLLPFMKIDHHEMFALPYLTRDYLRMKLVEAREKTALYYAFAILTVLGNLTSGGMFEHLARRGKHVNLWVVNDEDEMRRVIRTMRGVQGIMSDRPQALGQIVREETQRAKEIERERAERVGNKVTV